MRIIVVVAAVLVLGACANSTAPEPEAPGTQCAGPRPQVCTMEYNPVCAVLVAGGTKQYASPCNACADDAVAAYVAGPCPVEE